MRKIFTLIAAAVCAASVNAQTETYVSAPEGQLATEFASVVDENGVATNVGTTGRSVVNIATEHMTVEAVGSATPTEVVPTSVVVDAEQHWYEAAEIIMGDITWKNANNKLDINDEAGTKLYFVAGQGNAYENIYAEEIYTDGEPTGNYRPAYTYTDYEGGETGLPKYGLYYKFTPAVSGSLKVQVWVNKGNRKTVIVKESTGAPMKYGVDYQAEGYVNGQRANYETQKLDEEGNPMFDNQGNPIYEQYQIFFNAEEMLERHNNACLDENGVDTKPFVIDAGNQAFWGWLTFDVEAGESYYLFQLSSQLGFGGYEFSFVDGVSELNAATTSKESVRYNLAGQRVSNGYKGVVVENGKKYIVK